MVPQFRLLHSLQNLRVSFYVWDPGCAAIMVITILTLVSPSFFPSSMSSLVFIVIIIIFITRVIYITNAIDNVDVVALLGGLGHLSACLLLIGGGICVGHHDHPVLILFLFPLPPILPTAVANVDWGGVGFGFSTWSLCSFQRIQELVGERLDRGGAHILRPRHCRGHHGRQACTARVL